MAALLPFSAVHAQSQSQRVTDAFPSSVDVRDRAAVMALYEAEFSLVDPVSGWTGDIATCTPGTTDPSFQQAVLRRVNFFRDMAGLSPVGYDGSLHAMAQSAALIMAANDIVTHYPRSTTKCYTAEGAKGASSSLLAFGNHGTSAINQYIDDKGADNARVGHRAWLLSPILTAIATGDVTKYFNAIIVLSTGIGRADSREAGIAWPPAGYVPDLLTYRRWSYNRIGLDFSNASVSVAGPSGPVAVMIESREGWIDPGIVFVPKIPLQVNVDTTYRVSISGIGGTVSTIEYDVTLIPTRKVGLTCSSASARTTNGKVKLVCQKVGKKLVWKKG